ncbi:MAG: helix-turn-helix transcriptional regulator [Candidatus Eremiobacteraeota bacterium]|nr:helix-turn-helix transcriptional regulator [Candidatus Eremiobacteraeota bacterium]MBC5802131.1 helix-turn-helix transcriptional regulator [Candidatus Eremiobacteraeota bacterium]MBC5820955.1 helix-turn-helix transcriptional regulator [Candidatus Eremiobacteraeota bacterium]
MNDIGSYIGLLDFGQSSRKIRRRIAHRARQLRLELNGSQASVAASAGISVATLKRFEAGENVSIEALIRTALALDATGPLVSLFPPLERRSIRDFVDDRPPRLRGRRRGP